ncbi:MAG: hypothetical protein WCW77_00570 [Patescibacteria group bacterium]|jgi:hypothetical protein
MATIKQKKVFQKMVENGGSIRKAAKEVGYSDAMANNPQKITESTGFKELMNEAGLSHENLLKTHKELLSSASLNWVTFSKPKGKGYKPLKDEEIKIIVESAPGCKLIRIIRTLGEATAYYHSPDTRSRKEALNMAYKLNGDYAAEKKEHSGKIQVESKEPANPEEYKELLKVKDKFENELKKKMQIQ